MSTSGGPEQPGAGGHHQEGPSGHQGEHLVEHLAEQLVAPLPEVDPTKIQRRLDYIDVLRAVAVLAVFGVHIWGYWLDSPLKAAHAFTPEGLVLRLISLGAFGVDLFIVISGFCLAYPLLKGTDRTSPPRRLKTGAFYKRRAFRILPAYYAALLVIFLVELIPAAQHDLVASPVTLWDLVTHALLIQTWFPSTIGAINGPFWSIALEVQLYLVFPLLLVGVRKFGFVRTLLGTMVLSLIWFGLTALWVHHGLQHTFGPDLSKELPARWFEFMFGVGAARLVTAPRKHDLRIGIAAVVVGVPLALGAESLNSNLGRAFGWGLLAVGMVLLGSFVPHRFILGNPIGRGFQKLGVISFSFYLIHQPVLLLLAPLVSRMHLGRMEVVLLGFTVGVAITAAIAKVFFTFVEKPFLVRGGMRAAIDFSKG